VRRRDVEAKLFDQPRKARRLAFRQVEHQPGEGGGVDDRMLEGAFQPSSHQPRVERVMAVLNQDRSLREPQEPTARVFELRCADEHRTIDVVALARVGVDGRPAVHQRVEK
jgi:hypothetical protein